jgi:hypothetical protein
LFATAVLTAIVFQSETTSALAGAGRSKTLRLDKLKSTKAAGFPYNFIAVLRPRAYVSGMIATESLIVHSEACVAPLWFVSSQTQVLLALRLMFLDVV